MKNIYTIDTKKLTDGDYCIAHMINDLCEYSDFIDYLTENERELLEAFNDFWKSFWNYEEYKEIIEFLNDQKMICQKFINSMIRKHNIEKISFFH